MSEFSPSLGAVVFDLDGTLLDTAPEFVAVVQQLRAEHDREPLPEEQIEARVSDGARAMVGLALDITQESPVFEEKRQRFLDIYQRDLGSATSPYPGIVEILNALLLAGIPWGISTNKPSYLAEPLVAGLKLQPPPASLVCPDHVERPKPDPEPLFLNARQLECDPEQVIYVGDHLRDIEAGNAAGMYTIAAAYGYIHQDEDPADWGADAIATDGHELLNLLRRALR